MPRTRLERRLDHASVTVLGAGRAGSFACLALGMAGIPHVRVFDHDHLDPARNIAVQLYRASDVEQRGLKVEALQSILHDLCPALTVEPHAVAFPPARPSASGPIVLLAMDTMESRRAAVTALACDSTVSWLVDLRLGGSVIRCHSFRGGAGFRAYFDHLYTDEDSTQLGCAHTPDPHAALAAASIATASILAFIRGVSFPADVIVDLASPCMISGEA